VKSSLWRDAVARLRGDRLAMTSLCVLVGLLVAALLGPLFIGYREDEIDWSHMAAPPFEAGGHWLGTDRLGRDLLLRTLLGLRVDDVIRAVDWLNARPDVGTITVHGVGPHGLVALHAAVLDRRIERLVMEGSVTSYRRIVDEPLHRDVSEIVIPGVLRRYGPAAAYDAVLTGFLICGHIWADRLDDWSEATNS